MNTHLWTHHLDHTHRSVDYILHLMLEIPHHAHPRHVHTHAPFSTTPHTTLNAHISSYAALATSWILPRQNPLCVFSSSPHNSEFACIPMICCQKQYAAYTELCIAANVQNIPVWRCSPEACVSRRDVMEQTMHTAHLEFNSPHRLQVWKTVQKGKKKEDACTHWTWRLTGLKYSQSGEYSVYRQSIKKYSKIKVCAYWLSPSPWGDGQTYILC